MVGVSDLAPDLLPANASALESEIARLSARLDAIDPAWIASIWDAWRCPAEILDWLGWAMSVDAWDGGWSEIVKRRAIADSPAYHRRKGTRGSIDDVLALSGVEAEFVEWWEMSPPGRRGTSTVYLRARSPAAGVLIAAMRPTVYAAKPKARALFLAAGPWVDGALLVGGALHTEKLIVIEPTLFVASAPEGAVAVSVAVHVEKTIIIEGA